MHGRGRRAAVGLRCRRQHLGRSAFVPDRPPDHRRRGGRRRPEPVPAGLPELRGEVQPERAAAARDGVGNGRGSDEAGGAGQVDGGGRFGEGEALFEAFFASVPLDWCRKNGLANYEGYWAALVYSHFAAAGLAFGSRKRAPAGAWTWRCWVRDACICTNSRSWTAGRKAEQQAIYGGWRRASWPCGRSACAREEACRSGTFRPAAPADRTAGRCARRHASKAHANKRRDCRGRGQCRSADPDTQDSNSSPEALSIRRSPISSSRRGSSMPVSTASRLAAVPAPNFRAA